VTSLGEAEMQSFVDFLQEELIRAPLEEMANLPPDDTGLEHVVWLGRIGGQHGPRIKVSNTRGKYRAEDSFVISVSRNPKVLTPKYCRLGGDDLEEIFDWIKVNYPVLMRIWNIYETGEGSLAQVYQELKKI
jgi:hypothetical protein